MHFLKHCVSEQLQRTCIAGISGEQLYLGIRGLPLLTWKKPDNSNGNQ